MDYPNDPDDGHAHVWEFAEGCDTGTDEDPYVCIGADELRALILEELLDCCGDPRAGALTLSEIEARDVSGRIVARAGASMIQPYDPAL